MAQKSALKIKKKKWFEIIAPRLFNNSVLGETLLTESRLMIGRTIKVNAMTLTHDVKKQDMTITFKITGVESDKGVTEIVDYEFIPSSIKRMVRRGKNKIDDSFVAETQDKKIVRIKILILTRAKTNGSAVLAIRKLVRAYVISNIEKISFENLMSDILMHRLQNGLRSEIKKIYPVKFCEVRRILIEHGKVKLTKKPVIESAVEEIEETEEEKIIEKVKEKKEKKEEDIFMAIEGLEDEFKEKQQRDKRPKRPR